MPVGPEVAVVADPACVLDVVTDGEGRVPDGSARGTPPTAWPMLVPEAVEPETGWPMISSTAVIPTRATTTPTATAVARRSQPRLPGCTCSGAAAGSSDRASASSAPATSPPSPPPGAPRAPPGPPSARPAAALPPGPGNAHRPQYQPWPPLTRRRRRRACPARPGRTRPEPQCRRPVSYPTTCGRLNPRTNRPEDGVVVASSAGPGFDPGRSVMDMATRCALDFDGRCGRLCPLRRSSPRPVCSRGDSNRNPRCRPSERCHPDRRQPAR